ncbi:predicted protein, partial [Nematostella vectensis]
GSLWPGLSESCDVDRIFKKIMDLVKTQAETFESVLNILVNEHKAPHKLQNLSAELLSFLKSCLTPKPTERPSPTELLGHEVFASLRQNKVPTPCRMQYFLATDRSVHMELSDLCSDNLEYAMNITVKEIGLKVLYEIPESFDQVIFDLYWGYPSHGIDYLDASVLLYSGKYFQEVLDYRNRLCKVSPGAVYHSGDVMDSNNRLGHHTINGYPYTRDRLLREARADIPPMLRGQIWAALLGVQGDIQATYNAIDKESTSNADRQ